MVYIITSILPLVHLVGHVLEDPIKKYNLEETIDQAATWVAFSIYFCSGVYLFLKWKSQRKLLNQEPPE